MSILFHVSELKIEKITQEQFIIYFIGKHLYSFLKKVKKVKSSIFLQVVKWFESFKDI